MNKIKLISIGVVLLQIIFNQGVIYPKVVEVDIELKKKEVGSTIVKRNVGKQYTDDYYVNELLYFDSIPILVKNVLHSQIKLYENEYYSLPSQLKNSISKITITSDNLNSVCGVTSPYKVKGCARSEFNDILLDETYRYGDLLHESIHLYSYQNNRVFSDEFYTIYYEEGNRITVQNGNTHNIYEYYVSAYLLYMNDVGYLSRVAPKTKSYFDRT